MTGMGSISTGFHCGSPLSNPRKLEFNEGDIGLAGGIQVPGGWSYIESSIYVTYVSSVCVFWLTYIDMYDIFHIYLSLMI